MIAGQYLHIVWKASFTKFGKSRPRKDCFLRAIKTFKNRNSISIFNVCWTELNHSLMHQFQDSIFINKLNLGSRMSNSSAQKKGQLCVIRELSPIKVKATILEPSHAFYLQHCWDLKQTPALSPDLDPPRIITLLPKRRPEVLWSALLFCMCFLHSISL